MSYDIYFIKRKDLTSNNIETILESDVSKSDQHFVSKQLMLEIKDKLIHNIGLAIWRLKCFYETFVQGSTAVILLNFCAKNPPHRQAENR
jgi:hypothetical protein